MSIYSYFPVRCLLEKRQKKRQLSSSPLYGDLTNRVGDRDVGIPVSVHSIGGNVSNLLPKTRTELTAKLYVAGNPLKA